ncbi:MAG: ATP-grasp domain-containing protein, partial [Solirubrobacteraceae bacterium]
KVRAYRKSLGIFPYVRQIDTLAAEYPAQTNYLYLTYHADKHDLVIERDKKSIITLGSGVYRIGSSVEFDWCGVNSLKTVKENGYRSIMINYNPETVSTDYDVCDRLYFDELSLERVLDIIELEDPKGTIISMGGQIPNNLAIKLFDNKVTILGTSPEFVDKAENRHKFSSILDELKIDQPRWKELTSMKEIHVFSDEVGFPLLIRPSYVLSGAAMNVVSNKEELEYYLGLASDISPDHPVVVSEFVEGAKEIEVDAVACNGEIIDYAISEHVEFAGVHSGDATIMFPPQNIYVSTIKKVRNISELIAKRWNISGPFNIQYLAKDEEIKVIELNLRASRSFPFVSKVMKNNLIDKATKVLLGIPVEKQEAKFWNLNHVGVKASQFSFHRLKGADPVLGVDMASTGEVGCIGENMYEALLKSMLSVGQRIPNKNILFSSGPIKSKVELLSVAKKLVENGYSIFSTDGTHHFFKENGLDSTLLHWHDELEKSPNVKKYIAEGKLDLIVNIPKNLTKKELNRGYFIRRSAVDSNIPLITNTRLAKSFIKAFIKYKEEDLEIKPWSAYKV